ncbi:kinase-like domain-containing protein [Mycena epipterygia]|nr:kinase-like domain-containing protein [Mycena epipterygia]
MSPSASEFKVVGRHIKERNAIVGEKIIGCLVLQGLSYLHTKHTIHRGIKPSDILLSQEDIVKLCDFGVSGELVELIAAKTTPSALMSGRWARPRPEPLPLPRRPPADRADNPGIQWSVDMKDLIKQTLTGDTLKWLTPKDMLAHPWVVNATKQEVHMAWWICKHEPFAVRLVSVVVEVI